MDVLIAFILTTLLSFWGSLQLGLVNVKVIHTALKHGMSQAQLVALGGCLPEIIYAGVALIAADEISKHQRIFQILNYLIIPVFVLLGVYYLNLKKNELTAESKPGGFKTGFLLGMVNPQLIFYWTLMFLYIRPWIHSEEIWIKIFITLGAAFGAFLALWMFAALVIHRKEWILSKSGLPFEKVIGILFIALALWETISKFLL